MRRYVAGLAFVAGCALVAGCASPGVPRPPSLKLPEPARGLTAERVGDAVRLHWTTPSETTDGETIKGKIVAVICREEQVTGPCTPVNRREVMPGGATAEVTLSGSLAEGPARLLGFRVELENARGRADGATEPVYVAGGDAPGGVEGLRATGTRDGVLLSWRQMPDGARVEIRREVAGASSPPQAREKGSAFEVTKAATLRAGTADAGGMVDHGAVRSVPYRYAAQRVLFVRVGGKDLTLRGLESAPVLFTLQDVFPPAAPTGLAAVPGPDSIDLSWDAGPEADLAGYFILRRAEDGPEQRLNADAVVGPGFRDRTVVRGMTYRYKVTAVDKNGNESQPSAGVGETLR